MENNTPPLISMDKKYQTKDGNPVTILRIDIKDMLYPVVGIVSHEEGTETVETYTSTGAFITNRESPQDLVEVVEKKKVKKWINIYEHEKNITYSAWDSKGEADTSASNNRIACKEIEIEYIDSEGLIK